MEEQDALAVIRDVDSLRVRTRRALHSTGFPLLVFGVLTIGSIPVGIAGLTVGTPFYLAIGSYWAFGATLGVILIAVRYAWREHETGVGARPARAAIFTATAFAMLIGALTLGLLGEGPARGFGPQLAVSAGYIAFATLERRPVIAVGSILLAAVAVVSWLYLPGLRAYVLSALAYGAGLIFAGLVLYREE